MGNASRLWHEKTIKVKRIFCLLLIVIWPIAIWAKSNTKQVTLSEVEAIQVAGDLVTAGKYNSALQILTQLPPTGQTPLEIERWYLIAQIEQRQGNVDQAIKIYRKILDEKPDLSKIRYELALCYMNKKQWYRADYHLRLAMAGKDIPDEIKKHMMYYRYIARKNKNWNVWFNFGAAPDNNINQVTGGEECITTEWGTFCRQLPDPVSAVGYNLTLGGNYEFKLTDNWRWKSDALLYTNIYDKHDYDDLYVSSSTGPHYVWKKGDVWLAGIASRRWYGWEGYTWAYGGKLDISYDFTRKLSSGISLRTTDNTYDKYGKWMDGQSYSVQLHTLYYLNASKYLVLRGGVERDTAQEDIYANWRYLMGIGFGAELLLGFHMYIEPSVIWANYDGERWIVKNHAFTKLSEQDFTQRYSVSLSNNKIEVWGFVPTLTFIYTKRTSNIPNREYKKYTTEFTLHQRF